MFVCLPVTLPDFPESALYGLNDQGVAVGVAYGNGHDPQAFVFESGEIKALAMPSPSEAVSINNFGFIAGSATFPGGEFHACLGQKTFEDLGTLGGAWSTAYSLNNKNEVVGVAHNELSENHACLWKNMECIDLFPESHYSVATDVNDQSEVVGFFSDPLTTTSRAFLWKDGSVKILPALGGKLFHAHAHAINNCGVVVGGSRTKTNTYHACMWKNNSVTDLGVLPGDTWSTATDINDSGIAIGYSTSLGGENHPFVWMNGRMIDVKRLVGVVENSEKITITLLSHINNKGLIVGTGIDEKCLNHGLILTPSP